MKKCINKVLAFVSLFLCFALIINSTTVFAFNDFQALEQNAFTVTSVRGIVAGETLQLYSSSNEEGIADTGGIWSSSNPNVISCTPNGSITGVKAGDYADITCTSKSDGSSKTFTVYCVKSVYPLQSCTTKNFRSIIYAQPNNDKVISIHLNLNIMWNFLALIFKALAMLGISVFPSSDSISVISSGNFTVYGQYGNYAYIRFNEDPTSDGFIKYTDLSKKINSFLYLSDSYLVLKPKTNEYLKADYSGSVSWTVENDSVDDNKTDYENSIIKFDASTGKITAKKGGITSITASANGMAQTCKIYSIYMWPQEWKVTATKDITIYELPGIVDRNYEIYEGDTFCVVGDLGGSNSWCYIKRGSELFPEYSYAKIEDFSTKNTISYYNDLNIGYPIKDTTIKYISSPYAKRSSDLHRGFDITGGGTYIYGEELVSPVNGTVAYTNIYCYNSNKEPSYGYCITIISNGGKAPETALKDNVTGNHFAITFMHMSEAPILREGDTVKVGDVIGKIGNTGNVSGSSEVNPPGTHLHFEINNMEALIGNPLRTDFTYNINPIYFYMDKDFDFYTGSSAYQTYGAYWYGPDKKQTEE